MPWSLLSSTPSNEEVFHRILQRECKAAIPWGPGSINLWLFQALVSHYVSGKSERVNKQTKKKKLVAYVWLLQQCVATVMYSILSSFQVKISVLIVQRNLNYPDPFGYDAHMGISDK